MSVSGGEKILVKVSHYNPNLGGLNCLTFINGNCISNMANGENWRSWLNKGAIACPVELGFETRIVINGKDYYCKDRGGSIVYNGREFWIDILEENPSYSFGAVVEAVMFRQ